ncbi:MAG: chemotaxis protein CheB [Luteimonas sp.]
MAEAATRVALLARPGNACDRLQTALRDAGADVVLVADPTLTDADNVRAVGVQAILVALEPSVEDALERFDSLLDDPAITVIFDEADLAAQREGWDAARWVRHLAAKLTGATDVLPPGGEAELLFGTVPTVATGTVNLHQYRDSRDAGSFDITAFEANTLNTSASDPEAFDVGDMAKEFEALAAAMPDHRDRAGPNAGPVPSEMAQAAPAQVPDNELSTPDDAAKDDNGTSNRFHRDLEELNVRIASMELVDGPRNIAKVSGVVLVLAGIGGPDAVRQLLGGLPATFPRPVLIQQRLDGARHDKLVRQMQRATTMLVHLAAHGDTLVPGNVYILPEALGVIAQGNELRFQQDGDLFASLPADDSAVIVLSGSDPAAADAAMGLSWGGALVAGQMPEGCYDATAAEAVIARGATSGAPAELAKRLAQRWPA